MEQGAEAGDWKCLRILGQGSYGVVGLWKNNVDGKLLALKKFEVRIHPSPSDHLLTDLQDRFRKEVRMMYNTIDNPYIVATITPPAELVEKMGSSQVNDDDRNSPSKNERKSPSKGPSIPLPLLCMEFCSGGDLRQMLKRPEFLNGLPEKEVLSCLSHISNAISYLHDCNVIHRDIKPENIVIQYPDSSYTRAIYKLSDLGFAKDLTSNEGLCSTILGTLPYLAPEIYIGKKYDKTVDYWSFGLIAFEIICGTRPFLPGESPAVWIPLVEKKQKGIIAIYRTDDGKIENARDIPYKCHLSQLLKQCLVAWLPSMLQLEPSRRGKYVLTPEEVQSGIGDINALTRLRNMLNTKFIQIHTYTERLVYAIGRSVKMSEVQKWVARSTEIPVADQLILTLDGVLVQPDELAMKYLELSADLYLISRNVGQGVLKLRFPKELKSFLTTWDTVLEASKIRKVWISALYFVQTHLERIYALRKASEALRLYYSKTCTEELKKLINDVEKTSFSLNNLAELEEKLEKLELDYQDDQNGVDCTAEAISSLKEEGDKLKQYSKDNFAEWNDCVTLKTTRITDLEDLYNKFLKAYDMWKKAEAEGKVFSMEILVRLICQYLTTWEPFVATLLENVQILLDKILVDDSLKEKLQIVVSKLNSLIDQLMDMRMKKQRKMLASFRHHQPPQSLPLSYESSNSSSDAPETVIFVNKSKMSKSHTGVIDDDVASGGGDDGKVSPKGMSQSMYSCGKRSSVGKPFSPDFTKLMEETHIIKNRVEEDVSNAMSRYEAIMREKSQMDWEFVQKT